MRALVARNKVLCVPCELAGRRTEVRLSARFDPHRGYEMSCSRGCDPGGVLSVDMVGKVLRIHQTQYVLTPCCGTVQPYGPNLLPFGGAPCPRCQPPLPPRTPPACLHCGGRVSLRPLEVYDSHRARVRTVHLCPRHTPSAPTLQYLYNLRQLHAACNALANAHPHQQRRASKRACT